MKAEIQKKNISIKLIQKILKETRNVRSRLYLWGGEPLLYKKFSTVVDFLKTDKREVIICTNGTLIEKNIHLINEISENLELLVAIDGLEKDHNDLRGEGSFSKVMKGLDMLLKYRKEGTFKGKITIHTVITEQNVDKLFDTLLFFENKCFDMVFVCFPWFISVETSRGMDDYYNRKFDWLNQEEEHQKRSWHAFKYQFPIQKIEKLLREMDIINKRVWGLRVRYQPDLDPNGVKNFILGRTDIPSKIKNCLALSTRMDITPDGSVSACKLFSEFHVGDINESSIQEVWKSAKFDRIREIISQGLMPVCSKCNVLYIQGS